MSQEERDNTNHGVLFGNTRKRDGKKDPDLQGRLDIEGTEHWLSAWFFTYQKNGEKRRGISIVIGDRVEQKEVARPSTPAKKSAGRFDDMEEDIPF